MLIAKKSVMVALAVLMSSAGVAWAQAGGADVPGNAKAQGTKENGPSSTGMSKGEAGAKGAPTSTDNKPTATGGQPGGPASKN